MEFWNRLVPELAVNDLSVSLTFYTKVLGFKLCFERREDRFAYLDMNGAQLMLLQTTGDDLYALTAHTPRGRGLHFQIEVDDVQNVLSRVQNAHVPLIKPLTDNWYRVDNVEHGSREFFVADPDGFLFRFYQSIGERGAKSKT